MMNIEILRVMNVRKNIVVELKFTGVKVPKKILCNAAGMITEHLVVACQVSINRPAAQNPVFDIVGLDEKEQVLEVDSVTSRDRVAAYDVPLNKGSVTINPFLVDVIIPCYNNARYLPECIESVISQSLGFKNRIRIILVNDGSTDNTSSVCSYYSAKYPKNIVYIDGPNAGVSHARNMGMELSVADYIAFIDSDDYIGERYLEVILQSFRDASNIEVVFPIIQRFGRVNEIHPYYKNIFNLTFVDVIDDNSTNIKIFTSLGVYKSEGIRRNKTKFDENLHFCEDTKFVTDILTESETPVLLINPLAIYYNRKTYEAESLNDNAYNDNGFFEPIISFFPSLFNKLKQKYNRVPHYYQNLLLYYLKLFFVKEIPEEILKNRDQILKVIYTLLADVQLDAIQSMDITKWMKGSLIDIKLSCGRRVVWKSDVRRTVFAFPLPESEEYIEFDQLDGRVVSINRFEQHGRRLQIECSFRCLYYGKNNDLIDAVLVSGEQEFYFENSFSSSDRGTLYFLGAPIMKDIQCSCSILLDDISGWSETGVCNFNLEVRYRKVHVAIPTLVFSRGSRMQKEPGWFIGDKAIVSIENPARARFRIEETKVSVLHGYFTRDELFSPYKQMFAKYVDIRENLTNRRIWVFFDRYDLADDNAEFLYRHALTQKDGIEKYFMISGSSPDYQRLKEVGPVLNCDDDDERAILMAAELFVSSQGDELPFIDNNLPLVRAVFPRRFAFLQHGVTKDSIASVYSRHKMPAIFFSSIIKKEYESILSDPNYEFSASEVKLTGFPRYDYLKKRELGRVVQEQYILFAPTFRRALSSMGEYNKDFQRTSFCKILNSFINNEVLGEALKKAGIKLVWKLHPRIAPQLSDFDIPDWCQISNKSYQQLIANASMCVTDFSSVAFDVAYLEKPVMYYWPDLEFYRKTQLKEGWFDYHRDGFGPVFDREESAVQYLCEKINHNDFRQESMYKKRKDEIFTFKDKANCARTLRAIKECLEKSFIP